MRAIVIANVVSWPVSLFFLQQWLEGFETRIELTIFPFWVALVLSVALASLLLVAHVGMLRTVRPAALLRTK